MRKFCILTVAVAAGCWLTADASAQYAPQGQNQTPRAGGTGQGATPARTVIDGRQASQAQSGQPHVPQGFQLTAEQQKWVDQVLGYWEHRSNQVNTFTTTFYRDEFNPTQVRDANIAWTKAKGEIKYAKPDKAMYRVDEVHYYEPPREQGQQGRYVKREDAQLEHWVCDGQATFEFDSRSKLLIERPLPEHMRGEAIADGPLPFLFGAEAAKLKRRYWFAPIVPPIDQKTGKPREKEFWLAAKPKTREDAQNFDLVKIVIDGTDFLPRELHIYMPGGKERKVFYFTDRTVNPSFQFLRKDFSKPSVPFGWKKTVENLTAAPQPPRRRGISQIPVPQRR